MYVQETHHRHKKTHTEHANKLGPVRVYAADQLHAHTHIRACTHTMDTHAHMHTHTCIYTHNGHTCNDRI